MSNIFTEVLKIDCGQIDRDKLQKAADLLKNGEIVGMPTETVYGLAADATNPDAVAKIFEAKGRPQDNPLIVHVADIETAGKLVKNIPQAALKLFSAFWPGPLTVIMKKSPLVPDIVSAHLDTVAVRMPSHPVARELIKLAGPLAAPSANLSGSPSPTEAVHVYQDLNGKIPLILDAGSCSVGVESTVVSVMGEIPQLLRPGGITLEQLRQVLGKVSVNRAVLSKMGQGEKAVSPGMKYKHYAPKAKVVILDGGLDAFCRFVRQHREDGVYALCFRGEEAAVSVPCIEFGSAEDSLSQAQSLFGALREADRLQAKTVYARMPRKDGVGLAVYNRLLRAAGFEVIVL